LTTSVGTRIAHAAISPRDEASMWIEDSYNLEGEPWDELDV
jgi:hypothetical protein